MFTKRDEDPEVAVRDLRQANTRHDTAKHDVCMWPRARYRGGFGYPPDPEQKRKPRALPEQWQQKGL